MPHAWSARVPSRLAVVVALVVAALTAVSGLAAPANAQTSSLFVDPANGRDTNDGTDARPLATLQQALERAQPGTTINLKPGEYREAVVTRRPGTAAAPITIKGPETGKAIGGRYQAKLYGLGGRIFSINHSYYTLTGFTIDGQEGVGANPIRHGDYPAITSLSQIRAWKDTVQGRAVNSKLIYVGAGTTTDTFDVTGTKISDMFLNGSGGECVRFRNRATNGLVENSVIQWCGVLGLGVEPDQYKYHNAEGVYIGTSPKSTTQPLYDNDTSNNIVVRNTTINTFGSECFNVKENAHHNRIENSECGWNAEPSSHQGSNIEFRGDHNTVLATRVTNSSSWNLKLASDTAADDLGGNTARGSTFSGAATYAIINRQTGSGPFCGNTISGSAGDPSGNSVGTPTAACAGATTPTVTSRTPAANATGVAVGSNVTATFSEAVTNLGETNPGTFTLRAAGAGTNVAAVVTYDAGSRAVTLNPSADLVANTQYTATLTGDASGIKSAAGTPLATTSWTFTTLAAADTTAPAVTGRSPASGATNVAGGSNVTATFSEAVQAVSGTTFTLKPGTATSTAANIGATVSYDAATRVATLNPTADLAAGSQYTATLTGGATAIRDAVNNPLASATWTFTTAAAPTDTTRPTVTARTPSSGATRVSRTANLSVTFSEAVNGVVGGTGSNATFALRTGSSTGTRVAATVTRNGTTNQWTLDPSSTLSANTTYWVVLTGSATAIRDTAGNPLTTTSWSFRTGS